MTGTQHLLLLAVLVLQARCQQKPQVSMSPTLNHTFSGDLFVLSCDTGSTGSKVKWIINGKDQERTDSGFWKIGVAAPNHSGAYQCESNGQTSDIFHINILDYLPSASLTIRTGQPVVRRGGSVVLQLDNEDGVQGWKCWAYTGGPKVERYRLRVKNDSVSVSFQPNKLDVAETIFWCNNAQQRSNQVTVRTSEKAVSLEMYPLPAVVGESLTLRCLAWGTDQISQTVFYKDNAVIEKSVRPTYKISNVTESAKGKYKCDAKFTFRDYTAGPPYQEMSDDQDVFVQVPPMKAVLSINIGMSCSCTSCPSDSSYRWYHTKDGSHWELLDSSQEFMMPKASGAYACRAVWKTGRSFLSNAYSYTPRIKLILIVVVTVLAMLILAAVAVYLWYSKRDTTGPIYEDMPLRTRDKDGDGYELIQKGAKREAEYDMLHPEVPGKQETEGQYEALKKEKMTEGEYHTLGMEGATVGEGGYEALKKEGMKEGVYHTLGVEGAVGGEGGYEALKKEGMKEGEYHTLGVEGAVGGEGGYEALKKEGMKEGVYHTLGVEGAVGGE
ncbi:uncharacterized protein LOC131959934 [Centropristis striata]|uniref:uncharacterized protein LOC131959934 n=1 Tax=Centropristis striata TaxID=184440 RepID=UPI0027E007D8|nr:uncharacterized protein LOC131959934 [Centropristis striata]